MELLGGDVNLPGVITSHKPQVNKVLLPVLKSLRYILVDRPTTLLLHCFSAKDLCSFDGKVDACNLWHQRLLAVTRLL